MHYDTFFNAKKLETHASRGALFETWVVSELYKQQMNMGCKKNRPPCSLKLTKRNRLFRSS